MNPPLSVVVDLENIDAKLFFCPKVCPAIVAVVLTPEELIEKSMLVRGVSVEDRAEKLAALPSFAATEDAPPDLPAIPTPKATGLILTPE
jgi:DNA-binding transcriptional regulator of glucitol operon